MATARLRLPLLAACLLSAVVASSAALQTPAWDYTFPTQKAYCVDAHSTKYPANTRWVFAALPEGTPPDGGWPVFLSFTTDNFPPNDGSPPCGTPTQTRKQ